MSSVNSASDRANQEEALRRNREIYQAKETDTAKKHSQQLKHLTEAHQAELTALQEEHTRQMEEMREKTREVVGRRDLQYQKDIEELRELHQKQLQRIASEAETRYDANDEALSGELSRSRRTAEQQREILKTAYEGQLREKDKRFEEFANGSRKTQQQESENISDQLEKAHHKEREAITRDRDERIGELQKSRDEVRRVAAEKLNDLERQRQSEKEQLLSDHELSIRNERAANSASAERSRESFAEGVRQLRDRFEKTAAENRDESRQAREDYKENMTERLGARMRYLESENRRLKDDQPRLQTAYEHKMQIAVKGQRDAFAANAEAYEKARRDSVESASRKSQQELDRVNRANAETVARTNRFYQDKIAMDELRHEERFNGAQNDQQRRRDHEEIAGESRVEKVRYQSDVEQGKMRAYFDRATTAMKENFETSLAEMRERTKRDQDAIFQAFSKQAVESEGRFQEKLTETSSRYERQIGEMQEKSIKDLKDQRTLAEREKKALERKLRDEMAVMQAKYEYRIAKTEEVHQKTIEGLKQKHEESLANLTKNRQS